MPGIALHQHRAVGIQQFWDQFKVFVEFMDEQVMHDGQFAVLPIWTHLDLTPTPLRLVGRQVQKLHPVVGAAHFAAWKAASTDGNHMP